MLELKRKLVFNKVVINLGEYSTPFLLLIGQHSEYRFESLAIEFGLII